MKKHLHSLGAPFLVAALCGTIPPAASALDLNHDGMDDTWQARYGIAPFAGSANPDGDDRINLVEALNYSDPGSANSGLGVVLILDQGADGLDDRWQARFNITAAQALLDPDGDGRKNVEESIVGSDPFTADQPWSAAGSVPGASAAGPASFDIALSATVPGIRYTLQQCDDMESWQSAAVSGNPFWGDGSAKSLTADTTGAARRFFRFVVDDPDTDGDDLGDWSELRLGLNPADVDSDNDGFDDWWEILNQSDPLDDQSIPASAAPTDIHDETGLVELPVQLGEQQKWVAEYAVQAGGSGSSGVIDWVDDVSPAGHEEYYDFVPRWATRLASLQYPPGEYWHEQFWRWESVVNSRLVAVTDLREVNAGGLQSYDAFAHHHRVVLGSPLYYPAGVQPWQVSRRFLRVRTFVPHDEAEPPRNYYLGFYHFVIPPGGRFSYPLELYTPQVAGHRMEDMLTPVDFEPVGALAAVLDTGVYPPWLMLPRDDSRSLRVVCGAGPDCPMWFKPRPENSVEMPQQVLTGEEPEGPVLQFADDSGLANQAELLVGVHGTGPVVYSDDNPVLRFAVYPRRTLRVTVHPIALLGRAIPQAVPTKQEFEEYLDNVFGQQCNVFSQVTIKPTIMVDWDVGMDVGLGQREGIGNGMFDIFPGKEFDSDEEKAVYQVAPRELNAHVNVYWLACPDDIFGIVSRTRLVVDNQTGKVIQNRARPLLGFAGKTDHGPNISGVVYVREYEYRPNNPEIGRPSDRRWVVAHEIGHHIGNMGHSSGIVANGWQKRANSDNESRLMSGTQGPKRFGCPPKLIKEEWDAIDRNIPQF